MSEFILQTELKPLIANLFRLKIGYYLISDNFKYMNLELEASLDLKLENLWKETESDYYKTIKWTGHTNEYKAKHYEEMIRKFLSVLYSKDIEAFEFYLSNILTDFVKWSTTVLNLNEIFRNLNSLKFKDQNIKIIKDELDRKNENLTSKKLIIRNMDIEKIIMNRYKVLNGLYETTASNGIEDITSELFKKKVDMERDEIKKATDELAEEGLVEKLSESGHLTKINIRGKKEVERSKAKPKETSEHFPQNIYNVYNSGTITQLQQGSHGSSQIVNNIGEVGSILNQVEELFNSKEVFDTLTEDARSILKNNIDDTKKELSNPKTNIEKIKEKIQILKNSVQLISLVSPFIEDKIKPLVFKAWELIFN